MKHDPQILLDIARKFCGVTKRTPEKQRDIFRKLNISTTKHGKFMVGTDGVAMCATPLELLSGCPDLEDISELPLVSMKELIESIHALEDKMKPVTLPELSNVELEHCDTCDDARYIKSSAETGECKECDGYGWLELESYYNSYMVDCKSCDGTGKESNSCKASANADDPDAIPCPDCSLNKYLKPIPFMGGLVNPYYLSHLEGVEGLKAYYDSGTMHFSLSNGIMRFCIAGCLDTDV